MSYVIGRMQQQFLNCVAQFFLIGNKISSLTKSQQMKTFSSITYIAIYIQ